MRSALAHQVFILKREVIMNRNAVHWKVEYKTFSGVLGAITVRAGTSDDAKRITTSAFDPLSSGPTRPATDSNT
jgi:hypothetical protein